MVRGSNVCGVVQGSPGWRKAPVFETPASQDNELNAHAALLKEPS